MIWATNYPRMTNLTVWTMFFAGKAFAPKCIIDGKNIQDWLQDHYIDAVSKLAERISKEPDLLDEVVIGWDSMNEPGDGMIGREDLSVVPKDERLKKGPMPSPFQGMRLAMGYPVEVDVWEFTQLGPKLAGRKLLDPRGKKLWLRPEEEATRGGGKWGWERDPGWELGTCSKSRSGKTGPFADSHSLGTARDLGRVHLCPPQTRLLQMFSHGSLSPCRVCPRLLATALDGIRHSYPSSSPRSHPLYPTSCLCRSAQTS